jgi:hypothetical protein
MFYLIYKRFINHKRIIKNFDTPFAFVSIAKYLSPRKPEGCYAEDAYFLWQQLHVSFLRANLLPRLDKSRVIIGALAFHHHRRRRRRHFLRHTIHLVDQRLPPK